MRPRIVLTASRIALAIVVAVSAVGTSRYLWCESMQEARMGCCCPDFGSEDVVRAPCCELREIAVLDGSHAEDGAPRVVAALPAVLVAELFDIEAGSRSLTRSSATLARAGPLERVHAANSVYLL